MAYQFETGQYNHYNRSIVVWARQDLKTRYQFEVTGFEPYFYILEHETVPEDPRIKRVEEGEFIDLWGNKLKRVFTHDPLQVKQLRDDRLFERTWEADIRYVLRFIIDMGIRSGFTIGGAFNNVEKKQINYNQLAPIDYTSHPLYSVIDLEMDAEELPNPKNPVFTIIACTVYDNRLETYITYFLAGYDQKAVKRKYKDKIDNWLVIRFEKEINLILSIKLYLEQLQPTLIAGWNVDFDIDNLVARAAFLDIKINLRGMMPFDLMLFFPKVAQKNLGKKLKFVAIEEEILDKNELVMDEFDINFYKDSSLHDDLILYNCFDVFICVELIKRYNIDLAFTGRKDMAGQYDIIEALSNTHVIDAIALRVAKGQFGSPLNVILPTAVKREHKTYPAAINFPPNPGIYTDVALFDFSKFFPLTIMAYNFSPEFEGLTTEERLKKPKGILYWIAKVLIDNRAKEDNKLQEILETLGPNTEEYKLQKNHRDNAKFLLNALYGACAFPNFRLYSSKQMAKMVAKAMDGLRLLKTESEKLGYQVIYGHSIAGDQPVIVKNEKGYIDILPIEELGMWWLPGYETRVPSLYSYVWSNGKWAKVKYIVRHRTKDALVRVNTHTGYCMTTTDHSFFTLDEQPITPKDLKIGDDLLHSPLPLKHHRQIMIFEDLAWVYGLFMGDGTSGRYNTKSGVKYQWKIDNLNLNLLEKAKNILEEYYKIEFSILDVRESSATYRITPHPIKSMTLEYKKIFYTHDKKKKVPFVILNSEPNIQKAFISGYYAADGAKEFEGIDIGRFKSNSASLAQGMYYLLRKSGKKISILVYPHPVHGEPVYRISYTKNKQRKRTTAIKKITYEKPVSRYVYDIGTDNEKFNAGVGELVVHNTDSIMVKCGREEAPKIQDTLNKALKEYQLKEGVEPLWEVKFESYASKVLFTPAKSRMGKQGKDGARTKYAMEVVEKDGILLDESYTIIKGFETVRSDSSRITKELQSDCFRAVFNDEIEPFVKRVQKMMRDIQKGNFSYDEICIAMNLGKELSEYKGNNLQKRGCIYSAKNFGWKFGQGDRIKMLFVKEVVGYPPTDILCYYDEKKLPKIIPNYTKIIERTIKSPIELILQVAGYHWNRVMGQSTLFESLGI